MITRVLSFGPDSTNHQVELLGKKEFGKGAWGELTGYTLNTPCFMIP